MAKEHENNLAQVVLKLGNERGVVESELNEKKGVIDKLEAEIGSLRTEMVRVNIEKTKIEGEMGTEKKKFKDLELKNRIDIDALQRIRDE